MHTTGPSLRMSNTGYPPKVPETGMRMPGSALRIQETACL